MFLYLSKQKQSKFKKIQVVNERIIEYKEVAAQGDPAKKSSSEELE